MLVGIEMSAGVEVWIFKFKRKLKWVNRVAISGNDRLIYCKEVR